MHRYARAGLSIVVFLVGIGGLAGTPIGAEPGSAVQSEPAIQSESAILIDADTGIALFGKNANTRMYPASITKMVTAILALETSDPDETVTVSRTAREEEGTRIYLAEGEQKPMGDLLYGLMLNSGNDAATAIAEHVDGSKEAFSNRMNEFVSGKLGLTGTHFTNPSGLPDEDHYTTASDMAVIAKYAMQNPTFRAIVSTKKMAWNGLEWQSSLINHNKLIGTYEGATGIKNGYTVAAGSTLVASAARGTKSLIGVVLKAPSSNAVYDDMKKLLDYGFAAFEPRELVKAGDVFAAGSGESALEFKAVSSLSPLVRNDIQPQLSVGEDGRLWMSSATGAQVVAQLEQVKPAESVRISSSDAAASEDSAPGHRRNPVSVITLVALAVFCAIVVLRVRKKRRIKSL
ncbi:D-alanyl-D-alanine carboxypeptidase [Cohnella faecalis]|uniref:D-alanyl-D-alanine carboxypeptidase n=2 Tax=Cohnella faecalis TaxID=2315694 RepID=A0A398CRU5_9BACL|nr:D-alanyl-D-alanine carboxypeptidase [Cohnella faecalis]